MTAQLIRIADSTLTEVNTSRLLRSIKFKILKIKKKSYIGCKQWISIKSNIDLKQQFRLFYPTLTLTRLSDELRAV